MVIIENRLISFILSYSENNSFRKRSTAKNKLDRQTKKYQTNTDHISVIQNNNNENKHLKGNNQTGAA